MFALGINYCYFTKQRIIFSIHNVTTKTVPVPAYTARDRGGKLRVRRRKKRRMEMEKKLQKKPTFPKPKEKGLKGGSGSVFPAQRRSVKTMVFAAVLHFLICLHFLLLLYWRRRRSFTTRNPKWQTKLEPMPNPKKKRMLLKTIMALNSIVHSFASIFCSPSGGGGGCSSQSKIPNGKKCKLQ
jgi:hypothetical protein